jgi:hypothetical protein
VVQVRCQLGKRRSGEDINAKGGASVGVYTPKMVAKARRERSSYLWPSTPAGICPQSTMFGTGLTVQSFHRILRAVDMLALSRPVAVFDVNRGMSH